VRFACLLALASVIAVAGAQGSNGSGVLTARSGAVSARVTFHFGGTFAKDIRVQIRREGRKLLDQKLRKVYDLPIKLRIKDLAGDGEPEVLADFFTGGAHCCWYSLIYRYTGKGYGRRKHDWGNSKYKLVDFDHDGTLELSSRDGRFGYAFTSYASSAFPVQIWSYAHGRLKDTTRDYRRPVRKDSRRLWKAYRRGRHREGFDARGVLAAWMADQYLLGHEGTGWAKMRAANRRGEFQGLGSGDIWPKGKRYLAALRKFLKTTGYAS
jgi:hypothetical protein